MSTYFDCVHGPVAGGLTLHTSKVSPHDLRICSVSNLSGDVVAWINLARKENVPGGQRASCGKKATDQFCHKRVQAGAYLAVRPMQQIRVYGKRTSSATVLSEQLIGVKGGVHDNKAEEVVDLFICFQERVHAVIVPTVHLLRPPRTLRESGRDRRGSIQRLPSQCALGY